MDSRISFILEKAKSFLGIAYSPWIPSKSCLGDSGPFWSFNGPPVPLEKIQSELLNCVGLINVLRRELHLEIPGVTNESFYAGGTYEWCLYLQTKEKLLPIDPKITYPIGTLLLRDYHSIEDEGHLAIVIGPNQVIHSIREKGVIQDSLWEDYFEFACLPENWLQNT